MRTRSVKSMARIGKRILFLSCISMSLSAQTQVSFSSLDQVFEYAAKNNIRLITAETQKQIADGQIRQSYSTLFPTVTLNGNYTDNIKIQPTLVPLSLFGGAEGTYSEEKFGRRYVYNANLAAQVNLLNLQDWFTIRASKYNAEVARLNIEKTKLELFDQVAAAYYNYLLWHEVENISLQNFRVADSTLMILNNRLNEGAISDLQLNIALINRQKSLGTFKTAQTNQTISVNNLKMLLNIKKQDTLLISEQLNGELPSPGVAGRSSFSNADVRIAHAQTLLAKNTLRTSRATFAPSLYAVYQYSSQIAGDQFLSFENTNNISQQYFGLRFSVPLFTGGYRRQLLQNNSIDYQGKLKTYEALKDQADMDNNNLLIEYNSAYEQLLDAKKIVEYYQKNDKHAQKMLNEGLISTDDRLKIFSDYLAYQNEYIRVLSNYLVNEYRIKIRQTIY